ncbi:ferric reductase-like transmembrane domain-containing protein [Roseobacter ponti]|uniref:ferric reductase-like transmembrane domain-containing protein n=1 Tax=Roseobacter ponti TaxID=1891787 RepID=UPI003CCD4B80
MSTLRSLAVWAVLLPAVLLPLAMAAASPLLAWRDPVYIIAGFAGIVAMSLLLVQPLLARGRLPGLNIRQSRTLHRMTGAALVAGVVIHVVGLWVTSPPDVVDALLFRSPTPFSAWGVIAMWAVFAAAVLAVFRRRLRPRLWRLAHSGIAVVIVTGTVIHALQIEGTMETASKVALCALVIAATISVFVARTRAGAS